MVSQLLFLRRCNCFFQKLITADAGIVAAFTDTGATANTLAVPATNNALVTNF